MEMEVEHDPSIIDKVLLQTKTIGTCVSITTQVQDSLNREIVGDTRLGSDPVGKLNTRPSAVSSVSSNHVLDVKCLPWRRGLSISSLDPKPLCVVQAEMP
jgi:hypothetical protein